MGFAELRRTRLAADHAQVMSLAGDLLRVTPTSGTPPHVDEYELVIKIRTIVGVDIGDSPIYRSSSTVGVSLPGDYPRVAPVVVMSTSPKPYHPNWYPSGKWCYGRWIVNESLAAHIIRMIQTLQFDPFVTDPGSPADRSAARWWKRHAGSDLFPCDLTRLPDFSVRQFRIIGQAPGHQSTFKITRGAS